MSNVHVLEIKIDQTKQAFRVNGVTVAKRHLRNTIRKGDDEAKLARYLAIVPFLHQKYQAPDEASDSIKYGAQKAHRLYEALGLNEDAIIPFMLAMMAQAGDTLEETGKIAEAGFSPGTVPQKRTLH